MEWARLGRRPVYPLGRRARPGLRDPRRGGL